MSNNGGNRSSWSSSLGFVLAAAASAVGLGNIWRFPYLAAKDGGGLFIIIYIILVVTFGFTLLASELSIGRFAQHGPLTAYGKVKKGWGWLGIIACAVPAIILPYYCAIGGWVLKYLFAFITGDATAAVDSSYFTGFITGGSSSIGEPIAWMLVFTLVTFVVIALGVNKGIENVSKVLMPALLVIAVAIGLFSLTLSFTDAEGVTRTGLDGLAVYVIPSLDGITFGGFLTVLFDAVSQLFFSISVAMGIMVAYGSYVKKDANLMSSINRIELFDTGVALLAGLMIVPAVFTFMGADGMSAAGPSLIFVTLPKVFDAMGGIGPIVGIVFFLLVTIAAITSAISIAEAVVASLVDKFTMPRKRAIVITAVWGIVMGLIVCFGYNLLYFEFTLPNGSVAQILDVMDYLSNSILMPALALLTCILIGWVVKPKFIFDEVEQGGKFKFQRRGLFVVMVKYVCPILLFVLLVKSLGLLPFL